MTTEKLKLMLWSQAPALLLWIPVVLVAVYFDAPIPGGGWDHYAPSESWQNLLTFVLIINFLWTTAWLLIRRMPYIDWLTVSLAAVNWNFVALYLFAIALATWPLSFYQIPIGMVSDTPPLQLKWWAHDILIIIRTCLILNLVWSTYMLATAPLYDEESADV